MVKRKSIVLLIFLLLASAMYVFRDYVNVHAVSEGDLIITEMMIDPTAVLDAVGEWFEVYNPTSVAINMRNWVICDDHYDFHRILTDLYVQPADFAVLGNNIDKSTNGGVTVDYQYAMIQLRNSGDEIILEFEGALIDRVDYSSGYVTPGSSLQLHPGAFYSDWNDLLANWCDSTTMLPYGDYGTPGQSNLDCGFSPTPPLVHDVAITNLYSAKTVICQGCLVNITVTVENQGNFTETFNVTAYANMTIIGETRVTLPSLNCTNVAFPWNTTGFGEGNYTVRAEADTILSETDTTDNTRTDGWVIITMMSDLTYDGVVNMQDITIAAKAFGSSLGHPRWNPIADVNGDGTINLKDTAVIARDFGKTL